MQARFKCKLFTLDLGDSLPADQIDWVPVLLGLCSVATSVVTARAATEKKTPPTPEGDNPNRATTPQDGPPVPKGTGKRRH